MAFEGLTEKLQNVFKNLRGKGKLTEADVKAAMKEVRMALLEADVNFKVVKSFVNSVSERAVGAEVLEALTPGQQVIKIVNEEMISLMGSEAVEIVLNPAPKKTVIMMAGLQGAGKTTTAAKLAGKFRSKGAKPLLVACDVYRPAAVEQLVVNGKKLQIDVFEEGVDKKPADIASDALKYAEENGYNLIIIDTAGRLHIDEDMMAELKEVRERTSPDYVILTVDAMTGQDAVNVSDTFNKEIGIDGVIVTKLDGDARGGAALSIRAVTGRPIYYAGMGEKLADLEVFYPDRMASRILGMGDVLTLIEKAQTEFDEKKTLEMTKRMSQGQFNFNDFLDQMGQIKKMGGVGSILSMLPGLGGNAIPEIDDSAFDKIEAMILSMTKEEREHPELLNPSRKRRIAAGSGIDISEVNRVVKQFEQSKKMQKQLTGMMKNNRFKNMFGGLPKWQ